MSDRFELRGVVAPTLMLLVMAGCGGGDGGGASGGGGGGAAVENPVDAATAGNIAGSVVFEGDAPSMAVIDMSDESVCEAKHSSPAMVQDVVVNSNGTLANVFVYVKEGLESLEFPTPGPVVLDQDGCVYVPHVLGVMAGQGITFRNSDGLLHNIGASPTVNRPFNIGQPVSMEVTREFATAEVMVPVQCDAHSWMNAYIGVLDHPFHSVSNSSGAFSLSTLPPGQYVIEAWHETYGTQTQTVTVTTGGTAEVTFTFSASSAQNAVVPLGAPVDLHMIAEAS